MNEQAVKTNNEVVFKVHKGILDSSADLERNRWDIAAGLREIIELKGWRALGYLTFIDYISEEMPFEIRYAQLLVHIYEKLDALGVEKDDIAGIGWTKLGVIEKSLTANNLDYWLDQACELSVRELQEKVKGEGGGGTRPETPPVTRRFTLTPEQSERIEETINTCKHTTGVSNDSDALYVVCTVFLEKGGNLDLDEQISLLERRFSVRLGPVGDGSRVLHEQTAAEAEDYLDDTKVQRIFDED